MNAIERLHTATAVRVGYYVSVRRDSRSGLLYGPLSDEQDAASYVDRVRRVAEGVDSRAVFDAFGVSRVEVAAGRALPGGRLNARVDGAPRSS